MYAETLALEIGATRAGLKVVKPPVIVGHSGVKHRFSFMASGGSVNYGIDVYDGVTQMELLRTYAKKIDTDTTVHVVCVKGTVDDAAENLAKEYKMKILKPEDLESFFRTALLSTHNSELKEGQRLNAAA